jgi:hypothetical protein
MTAMTRDKVLIEIRDPAVDAATLIHRVEEGVVRRRAAGAYGLDVATAGPESLRPDRDRLIDEPALAGFPGLHESLAELLGRGNLRETDFTSQVPIVGPLIVAVRRLWNWMSTKWYVRPILGQQSEVNALTTRLLSDLAQWHEMDGQRLRELESRVAELETRLEAGSGR